MAWLRALAVIAHAAGFVFAWRCFATASDPVRALWWLSAASGAFWAGRFFSRIVRDHSRRRT